MSATWDAIKHYIKGIAQSGEVERLFAIIVSVLWKVPYGKCYDAIKRIKQFVMDAAGAYPGRGQGQEKWDYVFGLCREFLREFMDQYGEQIVEFLIQFVVKMLTARGEKT